MSVLINLKFAGLLANMSAVISPAISAKISHDFWARTHRYQRPGYELACLHKAKTEAYKFENEKISLYSWGNNGDGPLVLLIHGWNGRATQFFEHVDALLALGYRVLAFDAPGHGESSGEKTSLKQMADIVKSLYETYGEFHAIVAHSFGFLVAINSLSLGVRSHALIGIGSPSDFSLLLKAFARSFGLNAKAEEALSTLIEKRYGINSLAVLSIGRLGRTLGLPCLIVHDENDRQVPVSEAHKIASEWGSVELYLTKGLGHSRILRDQQVVGRCAEFLQRIQY